MSGCRWGQVWAREHFAACCTTSASYSGLGFPNFGPTWSGRQVRLGNFLLWVAANSPPGSLLELVADEFRSDTYLPVICLSHKHRYTSPGPVCIFPLSQWRRRRTRPRCLAAQCGWGPLGLFTPPSSSRVRGPGSPAAEQLLWPRRASMLSSVKKIQLLRFLTRIPPLDRIPPRRSPALPGTARLAASGSVAALQSCLVGRLKITLGENWRGWRDAPARSGGHPAGSGSRNPGGMGRSARSGRCLPGAGSGASSARRLRGGRSQRPGTAEGLPGALSHACPESHPGAAPTLGAEARSREARASACAARSPSRARDAALAARRSWPGLGLRASPTASASPAGPRRRLPPVAYSQRPGTQAKGCAWPSRGR